MDSVQRLCRPPAVFWELEEAASGHWNTRGTVVPMVVNHFPSLASHVPEEKQYHINHIIYNYNDDQKAKPKSCEVCACIQRPCKQIKGAAASEPNSDVLEPVPNKELDPASEHPLKLSSSCTMVHHGLPWPTVVHENTWIQFILQKCFINVHLASLVHITCLSRFQTPRTLNIFEPFQRYQKITQLCLRCCWKKLKPFSSVMATDSLPSLPHNLFKKQFV